MEKLHYHYSFFVCSEAKQQLWEGVSLLTCVFSRCDPVEPSFSLPETITMTMHLHNLTIGHRLHRKCVHVHIATDTIGIINRGYLLDELHVLSESPDSVESPYDIQMDVTFTIHLRSKNTKHDFVACCTMPSAYLISKPRGNYPSACSGNTNINQPKLMLKHNNIQYHSTHLSS